MLDSAYCGACHKEHYREWAGSMHAYAADDPIFRALNRKMQTEVPDDQKTFCLNCHAPMAVRLGLTKGDADALDATPELKGVGCFFCHATERVAGTHNNPLVVGEDPVLGGAIRDPQDPRVHKAAYRSLLDGAMNDQSGLCGSCHDIVTPGDAHIERTFAEWRTSRFSVGEKDKISCAQCHMPPRDGPATNLSGAPVRKLHDHSMVGVDLALTPFADKEHQRAAVQKMLDDAIDARLCVKPEGAGATIDVALINQRVGHNWPSGSNQDRRAWVELTAYAGGQPVLESGHVPDDVAVKDFVDPNLFLLRDHDYDDKDQETELFWRTVRFTSKQLPAAVTSNPASPEFDNSVHQLYPVAVKPDRVVMALKIRPVDHDLIETTASIGGLDRSTIDPLTTFTLAKTKLEWDATKGDCVASK